MLHNQRIIIVGRLSDDFLGIYGVVKICSFTDAKKDKLDASIIKTSFWVSRLLSDIKLFPVSVEIVTFSKLGFEIY